VHFPSRKDLALVYVHPLNRFLLTFIFYKERKGLLEKQEMLSDEWSHFHKELTNANANANAHSAWIEYTFQLSINASISWLCPLLIRISLS